jgi:anti-sigma factor RsiW
MVDVVSSDRHTVKPWFQGRLTFAPVVRDLKDVGFPLVGGRMDIVGAQQVAALVYRRDKHVINLFMWPVTQADQLPRVEPSTGGYHVVQWTSNGMSYWAVSDLETRELEKFAYEFSHTE